MGDLMNDLGSLPRLAAVRKINDIVKRIRHVRVHAILLDYLSKKMPSVIGKEKKKKQILDDMASIFREVLKSNDLSYGDFPDLNQFKTTLENIDFKKLPKLKGSRMQKGKRYETSITMRFIRLLIFILAKSFKKKQQILTTIFVTII